jgi:glutathione S-transferase
LLPASNAPGGALKRAQIGFFVDTLFSKTQGHLFKLGSVNSEAEFEKLSGDYVAAVAKEVEPLLKDAGPFFGGSKKLTFAEVYMRSLLLTSSCYFT